MIEINPGLSIPESELTFRASRSSGPGGQNVNKVNSRITIEFDLDGSPSLSDDQKAKIHEKLATRISTEGILQVSSQKFRTQRGNRDEAIAQFARLLRSALHEKPKRKKTRVSKAARQRRLDDKKARAQLKRNRSTT